MCHSGGHSTLELTQKEGKKKKTRRWDAVLNELEFGIMLTALG